LSQRKFHDFSGYEATEDAQVVMCDEEAGTNAFVSEIVPSITVFLAYNVLSHCFLYKTIPETTLF